MTMILVPADAVTGSDGSAAPLPTATATASAAQRQRTNPVDRLRNGRTISLWRSEASRAPHGRRIERAWERSVRERGRPSIAIATFVRLMVIKQRTGWGYETLLREVSDSLHLRRFCLIAIDQRVPDESTVRKLARRLGADVIEDITRVVIEKALRETRFRARAARIDSTVIEADIRYRSDATLALHGARALAREARKVAVILKGEAVRVRDRSRSLGRTVCQLSKTLARRTGEARAQVMALNERAGRIVARSARETQRLAAQSRAGAWPRHRPSCGRRTSSSSSPLAARRSPNRSIVARVARRSRSPGLDRGPDARPIRRASSASRPSSGTSRRSVR
jgi:transposase, IS5 family